MVTSDSATATAAEASAPSYADMLKLKQNPSQSSAVAALSMDRLTVTDNSKNNHSVDQHLQKGGSDGNQQADS